MWDLFRVLGWTSPAGRQAPGQRGPARTSTPAGSGRTGGMRITPRGWSAAQPDWRSLALTLTAVREGKMPVRQIARRQKAGRPTAQDPLLAGSPLRTPRAAAVAGIVFSLLLITSLVLLRVSTPANPGHPGVWLTDSRRRAAVATALNLVPFAGLAFLWLIGVIRDRLGRHKEPLLATGFLRMRPLFVALVFAAAALPRRV